MYRTIHYTCELSRALDRVDLGALTFTGDAGALLIAVQVTRDGAPQPLGGAEIGCWLVRDSGTTLRFPGRVTEGGCEALLPAEACAVTGRFSLLIRMTDSGGSRTLFWGEGAVMPSLTEAVLTAGEPLPDLDVLLARLGDCEAAARRAESAAGAAEAAAASWDAALAAAAEALRGEMAAGLAARTDDTEEANAAFLWEQGGINSANGRNLADSHALHAKRVRTVTYLPLERLVSVSPSPGALWVGFLFDAAYRLLGAWPVGGGYTDAPARKEDWLAAYPGAAYVRMARRDPESADAPIAPDCWDQLSVRCRKFPLPDPALWEEVPVGRTVQGRRQRDTTDYEEGENEPYYRFRVTQESVTALPFGGDTELYWVLPPWTLVAWKAGAHGNNLTYSSAWHSGGAPVPAGEGMLYFRAVFARISMENTHLVIPISVGEEAGCRLFVRRMPGVSEADPDALRLLACLWRPAGSLGAPRLPVIAHASDLHGDACRFRRFADFCDEAGVDLMAVTGDVCARSPAQGFSFCHDVLRAHRTRAALCAGNHDGNRTGMTEEEVYRALMAPVAEELGCATGKTWYLRDLQDLSLRVIALNTFQPGAADLGKNHLSGEQLAFLCGALAGTPDGWGILLLQHSPFGAALEAEAGNEAFFGRSVIGDSHASEQRGTPVFDIVDAFIGREILRKTWLQGGSEPELSAEADFTACGGEFIAHLTGHLHVDKVCPVPGTRFRQLLLSVTCLTPVWGPAGYPYLSNCDDLGRESGTPAQDAFNCYVLDRAQRRIRVLRVGQRFTRDGRERRQMDIGY